MLWDVSNDIMLWDVSNDIMLWDVSNDIMLWDVSNDIMLWDVSNDIMLWDVSNDIMLWAFSNHIMLKLSKLQWLENRRVGLTNDLLPVYKSLHNKCMFCIKNYFHISNHQTQRGNCKK